MPMHVFQPNIFVIEYNVRHNIVRRVTRIIFNEITTRLYTRNTKLWTSKSIMIAVLQIGTIAVVQGSINSEHVLLWRPGCVISVCLRPCVSGCTHSSVYSHAAAPNRVSRKLQKYIL